MAQLDTRKLPVNLKVLLLKLSVLVHICKYTKSKGQICLKIASNLRFRVILIKKKYCKSRISHSPDEIRQSLSSSMGGKKV